MLVFYANSAGTITLRQREREGEGAREGGRKGVREMEGQTGTCSLEHGSDTRDHVT